MHIFKLCHESIYENAKCVANKSLRKISGPSWPLIFYVCIMCMNNVDVSKLCMDDCMADKSSVYCLGPNVASCYKSTVNNG